MSARLFVFSVLAFVSCFGNSVRAQADDAATRQAIARALPYIEEKGNWWIEEKKCVSCHRISFMTWSLSEAASRKFDVNQDALEGYRRWSRESVLKPHKDDGKPSGLRNLDGLSQILWGERNRELTGEEQKAAETYVQLLTSKQEKNGLWKAGGQLPLQKRAKPETDVVSTMWHALALGTATTEEAALARTKAIKAIENHPDASSTEWFVAHLLLAVQDNSQEEVRARVEKLVSLQHPDGGWGWIASDPSDALATGLALYALRNAGAEANSEAVQKSVTFLVESQTDDGSWSVHGTKEKGKAKPVETANYWGTCWATIGLLAALPEVE